MIQLKPTSRSLVYKTDPNIVDWNVDEWSRFHSTSKDRRIKCVSFLSFLISFTKLDFVKVVVAEW